MNTEQHFRSSDHASFDEDMPLRMMQPEDVRRMQAFGLVALAILLAIIAVWGVTISFASSQNNNSRVTAQVSAPSSLHRELDIAFERHVEEETKNLCRYEWRIGRESWWPVRVLVCGKGRA